MVAPSGPRGSIVSRQAREADAVTPAAREMPTGNIRSLPQILNPRDFPLEACLKVFKARFANPMAAIQSGVAGVKSVRQRLVGKLRPTEFAMVVIPLFAGRSPRRPMQSDACQELLLPGQSPIIQLAHCSFESSCRSVRNVQRESCAAWKLNRVDMGCAQRIRPYSVAGTAPIRAAFLRRRPYQPPAAAMVASRQLPGSGTAV